MTHPWLTAFSAALAAGDSAAAAALFHADGAWRDLLAFTWNIHTAEGPDAIAAMLDATLAATAPTGWTPAAAPETDGDLTHHELTFTTSAAACRARLSLRGDRAQSLLTAIADLTGHAEPRGSSRPRGTTHAASRSRETWTEARAARRAGLADSLHTLIIGGGQGGIALAARLKSLGVPALVVERNPRAGDSWRNRYRSLVLHDPVWYDHLPYISFPDTWPVFTPKDQMGDWLEAYVQALDLDYWPATRATNAHHDGQRWTVTLDRDGETTTLHPQELVIATGAYGPPNRPDWPGPYRGTLLHSADYQGATPYKGKRAVVVGCGSSAHDIALDLWEGGAEVTMVQRRAGIVVRSETLMDLAFSTYSEDAVAAGLTTDIADWRGAATPFAHFADQQRALYARIREKDAPFYTALARAGFLLDFGEDDTGLMMRALRTASGYYIDVGCSQLIIDGAVKIASGAGVTALSETGAILSDGRDLPADVIIACTGYQTMSAVLTDLISPEAAAQAGPCWGLGSGIPGDPGPWQGELRNMWKPTAIPHLWFHGGNLALSRFYSRILALQLKARAENIPTPVYRGL
jgi:putative flavoprotein involved in K+ transport